MRPADERLAASPDLDRWALTRLQAAEVAVVGVGMLGGAAALHLALLGVKLVLIDAGTVEDVNLGNQMLPATGLGEPKSVVRARQIAELNPECRARAIARRIEDIGLAALRGAGLLVSGLDGRAGRTRVNEIASLLGIPWVDMAVDGSGRSLRGTITCYDPRRPDSPCYLCSYGARDLGAIFAEGRPTGCPSWRRRAPRVTPPTLQASAFGGVIAGFAALFSTQILLDRADRLVGRQLVVTASDEPRVRVITRTRAADCAGPHSDAVPLAFSAATTIADLVRSASLDLGASPTAIVFHGRTLVRDLLCARCDGRRPLVRLADACTEDDLRCGCGAEMAPVALTDRLTDEALAAVASWEEIGLPAADVVTVTASERRGRYVVNEGRIP